MIEERSADGVARSRPNVLIVVPCFNEQEVLSISAERLVKLLDGMKQEELVADISRILFVDDGSTDGTWSLIETVCAGNDTCHGLKLARNFGHQAAMLAGMMSADADAVVTIDADLQDPPEAVRQMVLAYREGAEIVLGVRNDRSSDSWFKRSTAYLFYRLLGFLGADILPNHADFRLVGRNGLNALKEFDEVNLFLRGIVRLVGFRQDTVNYSRGERLAGRAKYNLRRMVGLSLNGVTSLSIAPLRLASALGILISSIAFLMGLWAFGTWLVGSHLVPGWASTVLPMYFLGGIQLLFIGVLGEYVGKIYLETKHRPRYIIEKQI